MFPLLSFLTKQLMCRKSLRNLETNHIKEKRQFACRKKQHVFLTVFKNDNYIQYISINAYKPFVFKSFAFKISIRKLNIYGH